MADYQVTAYPVAKLPVPGWECFFARNDTSFHDLIFYVWVIRDEDRIVLVDTGPPSDDEDFRTLKEACQGVDIRSEMTRLLSVDAVLEQEGITAEKIDVLLLTQTITYHSGCLLPQYFPRAKVYLSKQGMMEFLLENAGHPPRDVYFTAASWTFLWSLLGENRLFFVDEPVAVLPDLLFETTGGHHPGSAAVTVKTSAGTVAILETAFLKGNIDSEVPIGVAEDTAACRRAIKHFKQQCDLVLAAHDNTILDRFEDGIIRVDREG
jgi:glyoxylase-like metal-dependent hydrolase (beta-lactamase superfamily II)